MSLSRTDFVRSRGRALGHVGQGWIKRLLPRTLFGRSVLILIMPLVLVQAVATWVFYDRLWDTVLRRLSTGVAGDVAMMVEAHGLDISEDERAGFDGQASAATDLGLRFDKGAVLGSITSVRGRAATTDLAAALAERLQVPFLVEEDAKARETMVSVQLNDGVLRVAVPLSRLYTSDNWIFMTWMVGIAIVTGAVSMLFLKNQMRSLRRLAVAADAFGKGRDVPEFRPAGASEVRQAAAAFLVMRDRIRRQITQRTEMLAGVSHDLRSPLTRMKLELELMPDNDDTRELKASVLEMQQMIEGYLAFARGEGDEAPQAVDVMELVSDAVSTSRRSGAKIELEGPAELYMALRREALRRCIVNLLGNAERYAHRCWVTVEATRLSLDIIVDDDGPGIPEEQREAVFRPFFRLENSRNRATGGVGLGLSIARDIVRSHGGELSLSSAPQGGLRARLHLPR
jgi:two-component system osmolarity sensor histidine kinase EnvZ